MVAKTGLMQERGHESSEDRDESGQWRREEGRADRDRQSERSRTREEGKGVEVKKRLGTVEVWTGTGTVRGVGLVRMAKEGGQMGEVKKRLGTARE